MTSDKEYCHKFVNYLLEEGQIQNGTINKQDARKIYMESFKPTNKRTRFSFSFMCRTLTAYNLIKYDKKWLIFKEGVLKQISTNQNFTNISIVTGQSNNNATKSGQTSRNTTQMFTTNGNQATIRIGTALNNNTQTSTNESTIKCRICNVTLANEERYNDHVETDRHNLLAKYVNNKKTLINPINGLIINAQVDNGKNDEVFLLEKNEVKHIILKLINNSGNNYAIKSLIEMIPRVGVTLQKPSITTFSKNNTELTFKISVHFVNTVYAVYPLIFRLLDLSTGKVTDILKELIFHVHSGIVNDLHANTPFTKIKTPIVITTNTGVVRGEHMKRTTNDFVPVKILEQYNISDNMLQILNNGFNEFEGMNKNQRIVLREIQDLLYNFKMKFNEKLHENNYFEMLRLLLFLEEYQMKIDVQKYSCADITLLNVKGYHKNCLELKVPGLAEHRPSLLRGDSVFIMENKHSHVKYEGIVHQVQQDSVVLGFSHKFINKVHVNNKKYYATFSFNRVPIRAEHQAINLMNEHRAITLLCKDGFPTKDLKNHRFVWFNQKIGNNVKQQQAVSHILSQTSRPMPYLVFGPPGTGKTVTIVEAVLQVWKLLPTKYILVCAPSNNAANEVAKRLVKLVPKRDLIRYVAPSYPYNLIYEEVKPYVNYRDNDYYHPVNSTLLTYRIVVTTLVNASRLINGGTPKGHFEYVFIDESGQATESETLIPIAGILTSELTKGAINGQIVLAGDPKQLGPIIHSSQANQYGFATSMLERLMKDNTTYQKNEKGEYNTAALTKLVQCYRSHPTILKVPNELFYEKELVYAADETITHMAIGWEHLPNPNFPVLFHSVIGKDEREENSPSFFNVAEIDVILSYLNLLIGNKLKGTKITEAHIGIIAPYRKQVQKLEQACRKKQYNVSQLFIGSVEQFQGQERLIIILTTVRSRPEFTSYDAKFHLGFLRNPKRFNVGITRAKALLIVVGNPKILLMDPNWYALVKHCKDNGSVSGHSFNLEPSVSDLAASFNCIQIDDSRLLDDAEDGPNFARGRI